MTEALSAIFARHGCKVVQAAGGESKTNCLWHTDKKPSLWINDDKGVYFCQSCGAKGNAKTLLRHFGEKPSDESPRRAPVKENRDTDIVLQAFDDKAPRRHPKLGTPSAIYDYRTASGKVYSRVFRFDINGGKDIRPLIRVKGVGYKWGAPPAKFRLPFNLPAAQKADKVVVVEGEKAAVAAAEIFADIAAAITWQGGSSASHLTNFAPACKGKVVYLWADADAEGVKAMDKIAAALKDVAAEIRVINLGGSVRAGYDAADALAEGLTSNDILGEKVPDELPHGLGYDDGNYYFWSPQLCLVLAVRQETNAVARKLLSLARLEKWLEVFGNRQGKVDIDKAVNFLIQQCLSAGYFDSSQVRGRGVNIDKDGIALSLGNRIIKGNGESVSIAAQRRRGAIYVVAKPIAYGGGKPLSDVEVAKFNNLISEFGWANSDMGGFLLGWLTTAIICGALRYRPHCWITGSTGSGKSWIMDNIIRAVLGNFAIYATSKTTEAGLRNILGKDALPVIMDEAETQSKDDIVNMQRILDLARQSYSSDGANIIKGKSGGDGHTIYQVRSSFLFSSINFGAHQSADLSRFINLRLRRGALSEDEFQRVARSVYKTVTDDFSRSFIMRAFVRASYIRDACEVFCPLVSSRLRGSRRAGDTYGSVLAAQTVMLSSDPAAIDEDEVRRIINGVSWDSGESVFSNPQSDDEHIINRLITLKFRIGSEDESIGGMLEAALSSGNSGDGGVGREGAVAKLRSLGIVIRNGNDGNPRVLVSDNVNVRERVFSNTQWHYSWFNTLAQSAYAKKPTDEFNKGIRFGRQILRQYLVFLPSDLGAF